MTFLANMPNSLLDAKWFCKNFLLFLLIIEACSTKTCNLSLNLEIILLPYASTALTSLDVHDLQKQIMEFTGLRFQTLLGHV